MGQRLQSARQAAGLTQQELCQRANLSFSTLTKIERGAIKSPSILTVAAIASAINISLDELVGTGAADGRKLRKTKSGVSFIFFDVNGTLVHYYQQAFSSVANDFGLQLDAVETAFWHFNDEVCAGSLSVSDFNKKFAERIGVDQIDWIPYYLEAVKPINQMHEVIIWAADNYRVGLLTNIMPTVLSALREAGKIPDIAYDAIVDSSAVGVIKPDPHIYKIAQERAGVPAEEILLVDDSRPNLTPAEKQGWHVLSFDDANADSSADRIRQNIEPAD